MSFPAGWEIWKNRAAKAAGPVFYHQDPLGSSVLLTAADGALIERLTYRPYGESLGSSAAPAFGFTGRRFIQALAAYDGGARIYDPGLGRFLQPAPRLADPLNPQGLNPYSYALNNPASR